MQPLKPTEKRAILENRPNAQPADVEEYERLLSQRFAIDPDFAPTEAPEEGAKNLVSSAALREQRIAELHQKLFGTKQASAAASH